MERILSEISESIRGDVSPGYGITNTSVDEIAREVCRNYYLTTCPSRKLLQMELGELPKTFSLILNIGSHFILLHKRDKCFYYIDPVGDRCSDSNIIDFVSSDAKGNKTCFLYNKRQVQSRSSVHCGLYCVLYAQLFDFVQVPFDRIKFQFKKGGGKQNDLNCIDYIVALMKLRT